MAYKQAYIDAKKEDIVITKSPVGMPGRAIKNPFLRRVGAEKPVIDKCYKCLEKCNPAAIPYCITKALVNAARGNADTRHFCSAAATRTAPRRLRRWMR